MEKGKNTVALYIDKDLVNTYKSALDMYEALKKLTDALHEDMGLAASQVDGYIKAKRALSKAEGK